MTITQTGLLERLKARTEAITLPEQLVPCQLVAWLKRAGDKVERFEAIAVVEQDQVATTITATHAGRLRGIVVQSGIVKDSDQVLCSIETTSPYSRSIPLPARPARTVVSQTKSLQEEYDTLGQEIPQSTDEEERRLAILPAVEQMLRERAEQRAEVVKSPPAKQPRTKAKVYRVTPDQVQRVKRVVNQVRTHAHAPVGPPISESELVRAGLELLTSLSLEAVLTIVEENREREQIGKYGAGWPRPGHHLQRKKRPSTQKQRE